MATGKMEAFDAETFGKLVALFDSNNPGEAENAFRKAVLMCAKNGLRFCDAAAAAFGPSDDRVAELQDLLQQQEAEHARHLTEAAAEIERLRAELAGGIPEGEHVIDLPGRLRHAWRFPQFRLFALTLAIGAGIAAGENQNALAGPLGFLCLFLFGAWSVAQFRKRGIAQMFLKWLLYAALLMAGGFLADGVKAPDRPAAFVAVLSLALVLTLTKVSEWLGGLIRSHVWESHSMQVVRGWF